VLTLFDGNSASFGNGSQLIFSAKNQASVDAFYQAVLTNVGMDEGSP